MYAAGVFHLYAPALAVETDNNNTQPGGHMKTYGELRSNAEQIVDEEIKERVLRGIEVLNAYDPKWPDYIDPSELLLESTTLCVLGQIFDVREPTEEQWRVLDKTNPMMIRSLDGFKKGLAILDGDVAVQPSAYGFDTETESYGELTEAWMIALGES